MSKDRLYLLILMVQNHNKINMLFKFNIIANYIKRKKKKAFQKI